MVTGLIAAIVGALVGAIVSGLLTKRALAGIGERVAGFQQRVEALESDRRERDELERFAPAAQIVGQTAGQQMLVLTADRRFTVRAVEYIADDGIPVGVEPIEQAGIEVVIPVDGRKILQINNLMPRSGSDPIPIKFRCILDVAGLRKTHDVEARIKPGFADIEGATTFCLVVTR